MIRANLEYFRKEKEGPMIILITSSISGEGKTFCSVNLAYSYASTGKSTLLIGADMRKPALARSFKLENSHGLSNYLAGQDELNRVIYSMENSSLSVIPGGSIPPNPAELLNSPKMKALMDEIRSKYDVIIFDTPPLGLVSDTIELIRYSFTPLLIVRQKVTYKKSLDAVTSMYLDGKLQHLGIVVNDVDYSKYQYGRYGYGYGYGYGDGYGYYTENPKKVNRFNRFWKKKIHG